MNLLKYFLKNWKKILGILILVQAFFAIIRLIRNFNQKNIENLFMIYFNTGLPLGLSIFLITLQETIFFLVIGYFCYELRVWKIKK